jgi:2-C-methyl-D-erythritol 2,4-cyclodiphosphate synthase
VINHHDKWRAKAVMKFRIGQGSDIHQLVVGRPLVLAGVKIPYDKGLKGHSDADVVLHAVCDALLGAAALGDIGEHFPDNDPRYAGIDSRELLAQVQDLVAQAGYQLVNVDLTIHAERPKLRPYKDLMRQSLAEILGVDAHAINIKAKTNEGLDSVGRGEAMVATAIVLIQGQEA